jgi:hypothetical protein
MVLLNPNPDHHASRLVAPSKLCFCWTTLAAPSLSHLIFLAFNRLSRTASYRAFLFWDG